MNFFFSSQKQTQHAIKADEMVHVGVGDKGVTYFKNIPWGKAADIAQIKHHRPVFKKKRQKKTRIVKRAVDQPWMQIRAHYAGKNLMTWKLIQL